jgi:hypothetical protein
VRLRSALLVTASVTAVVGAGTASAIAAPAHPAFPNAGAVSPSLSLATSASGTPEAAVIGKNGSLWYYTEVRGKWRATELGGKNTAYSGPSLVSGPGTNAAVAVEGRSHSLLLFVTYKGHWLRLTVAKKNAAYSAPSLAVADKKTGIAVLGKNNSLWYYSLNGGKFHAKEIFGAGYVYSAPSLVIRTSAQANGADPAGEADIAVEASSHAMYYVHSERHSADWQNAVAGAAGTTYSAPSLIVFGSAFAKSEALIMAEGPDHSLIEYAYGRGAWGTHEILSAGYAYSAPSMAVNAKDELRPAAAAYQGAGHSVGVLLFHSAGDDWQNDPLSGSSVDSAPALAAQLAGPARQLDLIYQGSGNTLWLDKGPPPATDIAPSFSSTRIGKPGTTYGG